MNGHGVNGGVNGGVKDGVNDGVNDRVNADLEVREQLGRVRRRVLMQHLAGRPAQIQIGENGLRDRAEIAPRSRRDTVRYAAWETSSPMSDGAAHPLGTSTW